ncbi:DUF952 domain-containing protein [Paeniglutamicibacter terrestris]|uniref:DUF952 domain-containing protein n=1 Tax=Paeniglutamicibacter terrestris TaxID=2723403 RepID=A0ABX1GAP6_9MICC|nr:DUF952 domain-containing protein [Paeniglutamicibacter terrestris]NKG22580.1 DUF952 domain-containing protein [Paeniglutamicibacter terrestris]
MTTILHLTELGIWKEAQASGVYRQSTRGATVAEVGFIPCSEPHQLARVASYIYADYPGDLVVLQFDETAISMAGVQIRYEDGGDGENFPHLYSELLTTWVRDTFGATMDRARLRCPGLDEASARTS